MENIKDKEEFLNKIKGRKDLLRELSLDRLEILNKYYDEEIRKKKERIKELQKQIYES